MLKYGRQFAVQNLDQLYIPGSSAHKTTNDDMTYTVLKGMLKLNGIQNINNKTKQPFVTNYIHIKGHIYTKGIVKVHDVLMPSSSGILRKVIS